MIHTEINYPVGLPMPVRDGYGIKHTQPFQRTQMEDGRARQRRRFSSVPSTVNVSWIFKSDNEAALFEAWFRDAVNDGAEWFNSPLKTPIGEGQYVCRFVSMYTGPDPIGARAWRVNAVLETWERPLLPPGWGQFPEFVLGSSIIDIALNREWPEA
ncbi:MAG: hypothetical protein ACTJH7_02515 [Alcaligenes sp.]